MPPSAPGELGIRRPLPGGCQIALFCTPPPYSVARGIEGPADAATISKRSLDGQERRRSGYVGRARDFGDDVLGMARHRTPEGRRRACEILAEWPALIRGDEPNVALGPSRQGEASHRVIDAYARAANRVARPVQRQVEPASEAGSCCTRWRNGGMVISHHDPSKLVLMNRSPPTAGSTKPRQARPRRGFFMRWQAGRSALPATDSTPSRDRRLWRRL